MTDAPKAKKVRKRPIGFYIAGSWLGLVVLAAIFGPLLPLPKWDESFYDYLGSRPGTAGHILGTTQDGYDMLAGLVNGAKISGGRTLTASDEIMRPTPTAPTAGTGSHTSPARTTMDQPIAHSTPTPTWCRSKLNSQPRHRTHVTSRKASQRPREMRNQESSD